MEQLMLDFKSQEGKTISFNVKDRIYNFVYEIEKLSKEKHSEDGYLLTVLRTDKWVNTDYRSGYQIVLPVTKRVLIKTLGGWIRNQIIYDNDNMNAKRTSDWNAHDKWLCSKDYSKLRSYAYLRSTKISQVIGGMAWKSILTKCNISEELMKRLSRIAFRFGHGTRKDQMYITEIYRSYARMSPYMGRLFLSDLEKYNVSFAKHILMSVGYDAKYMFPEGYTHLLQNTSSLIKNCKYGFVISEEKSKAVLGNYIPQTRWQWFGTMTSCAMFRDYMLDKENLENSWYADQKAILAFTKKLPFSDISIWHYFKKYNHIKGPYSTKHIKHMFQIVADGARIYSNLKNNGEGISVVPVEGSAMRMIRNAIYNHRQHQEYNKKKAFSSPNKEMPKPPCKLPEWIEAIRIKTTHDMIKAGIECEHCIGSYTNSNDIFVREFDICAQITSSNLSVQQCFDIRDKITKESENLNKRLVKSLAPLKKVLEGV